MVTDTTVLVIITVLINYITIYQKSKIFGDIIFLAIGAATYLVPIYTSNGSLVDPNNSPWGLIIMFIALADTIYNLFFTKS